MFLISDLAGERRFASTVAKRLESLGALTHGDRRATETRDLSQFNIDNKYGRTALESIMKSIMGYEQPLVPPPKDYRGDFFKDIAGALVGVSLIVNSEATPGVLSLDKDYNNISKFLNRILGMPVELQNRLFKYFTDTLNATISAAKKTGRFDLGILGKEIFIDFIENRLSLFFSMYRNFDAQGLSSKQICLKIRLTSKIFIFRSWKVRKRHSN